MSDTQHGAVVLLCQVHQALQRPANIVGAVHIASDSRDDRVDQNQPDVTDTLQLRRQQINVLGGVERLDFTQSVYTALQDIHLARVGPCSLQAWHQGIGCIVLA
ncbi:hypothetical protein D3C85_1188140 [compost metagenome]